MVQLQVCAQYYMHTKTIQGPPHNIPIHFFNSKGLATPAIPRDATGSVCGDLRTYGQKDEKMSLTILHSITNPPSHNAAHFRIFQPATSSHNKHTHTSTHTNIQTHTPTHTQAHTQAHTNTHIQTQTHTPTYTPTHTNTHTSTHTHTHKYTHRWTHTNSAFLNPGGQSGVPSASSLQHTLTLSIPEVIKMPASGKVGRAWPKNEWWRD